MAVIDVWNEVLDEAARATEKYGYPTSTHESLGVLLEEFDELKEAIHANAPDRVTHEAIQVAAVAYRLALATTSGNMEFHERSGFHPQKRVA